MNQNEFDRITNATVYDNDGDKIGSVGQLYLDDKTGQPAWVTVNTGLFGTSETFIPLTGHRFDGDKLTVPYTKEQVKDAPKVEADQHITPAEESELYAYYDGHRAAAAGVDHDRVADRDRTVTNRDGVQEMTASEERLNVGKEQVEAGTARLRKYTTTEQQTVSVPVTKEKLVVERTPADGTRSNGTIDEGTDVVEEITLREERPVVSKETVDVENVRVGKEQVTENVTVSDEVRKEHIEVEGEGVADGRDRR